MNFISISNKELFTTRNCLQQKHIVVWKFTSLEAITHVALEVFAQKGQICIWKVNFLSGAVSSQFFCILF